MAFPHPRSVHIQLRATGTVTTWSAQNGACQQPGRIEREEYHAWSKPFYKKYTQIYYNSSISLYCHL